MTKNGSSFSRLAKGLLAGALVGAGITLLHASRNGTRLGRNLPQWDDPPQQRNQSLSPTEDEREIGATARAKTGNGWRVVFYVASAVAMISDWKMKKHN
jgi:hypothetical protein